VASMANCSRSMRIKLSSSHGGIFLRNPTRPR
jgi:hypothetical protein